MKVTNDPHSEFSNLSNWKEEAWKKSGLQWDSNPWPPRYRCDALPTELWSHTLGARSICWVHIFPWGVKWCKYIWNNSYIWTVVIDESEEWSSQWIFQFKQLERRSLKKPRLQRDSLPMCGFIAQLVEHRTGIAEVTGSNPIEALIFSRLLLSSCLNWKIHCEDHSSLSNFIMIRNISTVHTCNLAGEQ